jgi:hypothetical protein
MFGQAYIITDCIDPRLIGERVTFEQIIEASDEVRLDPDFLGEHWYFKPGEVFVRPAN